MSFYNNAFFRRELRGQSWATAVITLLLMAFAATTVFTFDFVRAMLSGLADFPGVRPGELEFILRNFTAYLWANWFRKTLWQTGILAAWILGAGVIAGEVSRGTIEFSLSRPVPRRALLGSKGLAGAVSLLVITVIPTVSLLGFAVAAGRDVQFEPFLYALPLAYLSLLIIYILAMWASVLLADPLKAGLAAALATILLFVPSALPGTAPYSLFFYLEGGRTLLEGTIPGGALAVLLLLAAGFYWLALRSFQARDY